VSPSPITTRTTVVDGLTIRYAQSEAQSGRPEALLLSPWPESVFAYEQCWPQLAERARLVALDPPGFGGSQRRDNLMSPKATGAFILRVADTLGLDHPHVVGPDIGTSSALFAAAAQPGRFRSIVVGSGGAAVPLELTGVLKEWVEAPDLEPYRQMDSAAIVNAALSTIDGYTPSEEIRADYLKSYAGDRFVESMKYVRAYGEQLPQLAELLAGIETPVRIVAGAQDQVVPPVNGRFLHERLPNSRVDLIEGAGHFCWEEKPDAYAALVADWWERAGSPS
jgi:pimeloyl-ACP methyl ester carboxylesterase